MSLSGGDDHVLGLGMESEEDVQLADTIIEQDENDEEEYDDYDEEEEIFEDLDHEPGDQRPRWTGSIATWRRLTEPERELATSLDQIRGQDLSAHLYNSHMLDVRAYNNSVPEQNLPNWASKKRWARSQTTENKNRSIFVPPQSWTAWPMPPEEVPREDGSMSTSSWKSAVSSSTILQEQIMALILRNAKIRSARRIKSGKEPAHTFDSPSNSQTSQDSATDEPSSDDEIASDSRLKDEAYTTPRARSDEDEPEGSTVDEPTQTKSSSTQFLADDDDALKLTIGSIQRIQSKLDDLLWDLHTTRNAFLPNSNNGSSSEAQSESEDEHSVPQKPTTTYSSDTSDPVYVDELSSESSSSQNGHETAPSPSSDQSYIPTKQKDRDESLGSASDTNLAARQSQSRDEQEPGSRGPRTGTRDWSEVLGLASLCGWDAGVVERAAQRCANLFQEGMMFRTLREDASECEETTIRPKQVESDAAEHTDESFKNHGTGNKVSSLLACPIADCKRHDKPFVRWVNLERHLKRLHPKILVSDELPFSCPVPNCLRNMRGFNRKRNYTYHMRTQHPDITI